MKENNASFYHLIKLCMCLGKCKEHSRSTKGGGGFRTFTDFPYNVIHDCLSSICTQVKVDLAVLLSENPFSNHVFQAIQANLHG